MTPFSQKHPFPDSNPDKTSSGQRIILMTQIKRYLEDLNTDALRNTYIPHQLLTSRPYQKLIRHLQEHKPIREDSGLWTDIQNAILESSPDFIRNIYILVGRQLKAQDYHAILLIKCGMKPSHLTILTGRTKGTISYRRRQLCKYIFSDQIASQYFDHIIQFL